MKKYIFATIIALMALTSCRLSEGDFRNETKVPNILYDKMRSLAFVQQVPFLDYAVFTEMLMTGDEQTAERIKNQYFPEGQITSDDGVYYFAQKASYNYPYILYVATDGKTLAEGGQWKAGYVYDIDNPSHKTELVSIWGNADEECCFTISCTKDEFIGYEDELSRVKLEAIYTNRYELVARGNTYILKHLFDTTATYTNDSSWGTKKENYRIEWRSLEPVCIVNSALQTMSVDIIYENLDDGTGHHVAVYVDGWRMDYERFPYTVAIPKR